MSKQAFSLQKFVILNTIKLVYKTFTIEHKIDEMVYKLYELTPEEIVIVRWKSEFTE